MILPITHMDAIMLCIKTRHDINPKETVDEKYISDMFSKSDTELIALYAELVQNTPFPDNRIQIIAEATIKEDTKVVFNSLKELTYTLPEVGPLKLYVKDKFIGTIAVYVTIDMETFADKAEDAIMKESDFIKFITINGNEIDLSRLTKKILN